LSIQKTRKKTIQRTKTLENDGDMLKYEGRRVVESLRKSIKERSKEVAELYKRGCEE